MAILLFRLSRQVYEKTRIGLFCKHTFLPIVVQFAILFDRGIECFTVS